MKNSYDNPINTNYESPMKKYETPKMNEYGNNIRNYNDYKPLNNNYSFNPINNYSNRNNYSSLEMRARSQRYTYECRPNNSSSNFSNNYRSPRNNNLTSLNYYNKFRTNNTNYDDDCCNSSFRFRNHNSSYRTFNTTGY